MAHGHPIKNHFVASLGEFVGTFLFLFFAFGGTQTANQSTTTSTADGPNLQQLMYISLIFGFSLAINVWIFFRVSGGLFNPAVSLIFFGILDLSEFDEQKFGCDVDEMLGHFSIMYNGRGTYLTISIHLYIPNPRIYRRSRCNKSADSRTRYSLQR